MPEISSRESYTIFVPKREYVFDEVSSVISRYVEVGQLNDLAWESQSKIELSDWILFFVTLEKTESQKLLRVLRRQFSAIVSELSKDDLANLARLTSLKPLVKSSKSQAGAINQGVDDFLSSLDSNKDLNVPLTINHWINFLTAENQSQLIEAINTALNLDINPNQYRGSQSWYREFQSRALRVARNRS